MKSLLTLLIVVLTLSIQGQTNYGAPEIDEGVSKTKQHKRNLDYAARRNNTSAADWLKYQEWKKVKSENNKSANVPWTNYGPDTISGRIISIAFHPTDNNTFLVGAASGGLWRTTDYGNTWTVLTDDYYTMGIGAVAYNPQNPNSILIATGEGYDFGGEFTFGFGVIASYDGGSTWQATAITATLSQSFAGMDILWNSVDTNQICIASSFGIYHSSDGGANYNFALSRIGGRMLADPQDPSRLYFTARYYSAAYPGGLYISINSGASWMQSPFSSGLPADNDFGFSSIAIHPTYNNIVFVSVSQSPPNGSGPLEGLYKSNNFGLTFTQVAVGTDYFCYPPPYQSICLGWYANTLLIDPADTNHLFAGGPRLWTSLDGGVTWTNCDTTSTGTYAVHPDHHQTVFHPSTGDLIDCNDGGVNFSSDLGVSWGSMSEGLITHQFYSIASAKTDNNVVIGGAQDVGTFTSTTAHTGGWKNPTSGDGFGHVIDHTNAAVWYGTNYLNYQRVKTVNSGAVWTLINLGTSGVDQWRMPMAMHPVDAQVLLSSNDNFTYKSTNGGNLWSTVANLGFIGNFEFDQVNPNVVYAYSLFGGTIYKSIDAGDTWSIMAASPGNPITDLAADPNNFGVVYATVGSFTTGAQVYKTTNGGITWVNSSANLPAVPANCITVSPFNSQEIYVGNEFGVWMSQDGGGSYTPFNDGLPAAIVVEDMHYQLGDSTLRIGTYGRGYWRTKAMNVTVGLAEQNNAKSVTIYPNPATEQLYIDGDVNITNAQIIDITGRVIKAFAEVTNVISVDDLPKGIYFLKLETADGSVTKKFIKQ